MISFEPAQILETRASRQARGDAVLVHEAVAAVQLDAVVEDVVLDTGSSTTWPSPRRPAVQSSPASCWTTQLVDERLGDLDLR